MAGHESEHEFLTRLRAHDRSAFEAMVREHGGRMRAVARRLVGNDADVDEVVQEAFLSAFRGLDRFRGESGLSSWLHRIVINAALMRLRSTDTYEDPLPENLVPRFAESGAHAQPVEPWTDEPLTEVLRAEACSQVRSCIDQLPATLRAALVLRDIEELPNEETARQLGVSVNAAKLRVHRGRLALRLLLERSFERTAR